MRSAIRRTFRGEPRSACFLPDLLTTLFPRVCPLCRERSLTREEDFCVDCAAGFSLIEPPCCKRCGEPLSPGIASVPLLCGRCLTDPAGLPGDEFLVRSAAHYTGELRRAILLLKYGRQTWMGSHLGLFLLKACRRLFPGEAFHGILPVPLHPRRLRERGFNQCQLIARPLGKSLRIPVELQAVRRIRYTPAQSASGPAERRRNLVGAFGVHRPAAIRGRSILVVDDVYTSGATMNTLASTLFRAGARRVCGLTLARSSRLPRALP